MSGLRETRSTGYLEDKDKLHETLRPFVERRRTPGREEMLEAHDGVAALRREWDSVAARYDAVITPSVTGEAPEGLGDTGSAVRKSLLPVCPFVSHFCQPQSARLRTSWCNIVEPGGSHSPNRATMNKTS